MPHGGAWFPDCCRPARTALPPRAISRTQRRRPGSPFERDHRCGTAPGSHRTSLLAMPSRSLTRTALILASAPEWRQARQVIGLQRLAQQRASKRINVWSQDILAVRCPDPVNALPRCRVDRACRLRRRHPARGNARRRLRPSSPGQDVSPPGAVRCSRWLLLRGRGGHGRRIPAPARRGAGRASQARRAAAAGRLASGVRSAAGSREGSPGRSGDR
jgi:hypothetical protein